MGGFLASIDSADEFSASSQHLSNKYPSDRWWWLSGSDLNKQSDWYWYSTGKRISYTNWSSGQPDNAGGIEHCMNLWYMNNKHEMNDLDCNRDIFFICEADKSKTYAFNFK